MLFIALLYILLGQLLPVTSAKYNTMSSLSRFLHWPINMAHDFSSLSAVNLTYYVIDAFSLFLGVTLYVYKWMLWPWSELCQDWLSMYEFEKHLNLCDVISKINDISGSNLVEVKIDKSNTEFCKLIAYIDTYPPTDAYIGIMYCFRINLNAQKPLLSTRPYRDLTTVKLLVKIDSISIVKLVNKFGPLIKINRCINWESIKEMT
jgi:hypothetical protein